MTLRMTKSLGVAFAMMATLSACSKKESSEPSSSTSPEVAAPGQSDAPPENAGPQAVAQLSPTQGNSVNGTVTFAQATGGVKVTIDLQGLTPGKHGFHIHDKGGCSAPDGSSAGDHYNPHGAQHGAPGGAQRHAGDFGNVDADPSGRAHSEFTDTHITLEGSDSVVGRALIVHEKEDDLTSQPSGNAGKRLACGVIERK